MLPGKRRRPLEVVWRQGESKGVKKKNQKKKKKTTQQQKAN